MYARFPFFSLALIYAINLDAQVSIILGDDNFYWVVNQNMVEAYLEKSGVLIHTTNGTTGSNKHSSKQRETILKRLKPASNPNITTASTSYFEAI